MSITFQELRPAPPLPWWKRYPLWIAALWRSRGLVDGFLIAEGSVIPRGFGIAYRLWDRDCALVLPVPLNWLVGWTRAFWLFLKRGPNVVSWEERARRAERYAFQQADRAADCWVKGVHEWDAGFERGVAVERDSILRALDQLNSRTSN